MSVIRFPHPEFRKGIVTFGKDCFVSEISDIDATGDIVFGDFCMIGHYAKIFTHDHFHEGRDKPLLLVQREKGVKWQNKKIGNDVWLHECIILYQVDNIPDGVVIGAGSVLTKNPGPYEIWAGNPAIKVGER
ncbi:MAG: acyltransferase [Thermoplasmata archaeon]|nr:acyltransferase [Thermoplasmata archaeon]